MPVADGLKTIVRFLQEAALPQHASPRLIGSALSGFIVESPVTILSSYLTAPFG